MIQSGLLCALVFAICNGIDRVLGWQTLTRPIVVAPLTGLFLGDFQTGIVMGAALESIFMGISAIGGSIPADATTSSIIAVAFTIISGINVEAGLAIAMPIGTVMATVNELVKPIYASLAPYWEKLAASGNVKSYRTQVIIFGLVLDRLAQTCVVFIAIAFGVESLQLFINSLPVWVMSGLSAASAMMTGIGFAILTSMIWNKEVGVFFFAGFVLAKYIALPTLPIALLATVVAVMYFFNEKKMVELKASLSNSNNQTNNEEDFF